MTSATDTLTSVRSRSDQEVVRHRIEGWIVSASTTNRDNAGGTKGSYASVLSGVDNTRSCNVLAGHFIVPRICPTGCPDVAWNYGDTAAEELSEWTLSLEVKV